MERLRDEVGEAVQLIIREGDQAIYVEKTEGTQPVRLYTAAGGLSRQLGFSPKQRKSQ